MLSPISSGIPLANQFVVPSAVPDPATACQVTFVTPTPSEAVPFTSMVADRVVTTLVAGDTKVSVGGV